MFTVLSASSVEPISLFAKHLSSTYYVPGTTWAPGSQRRAAPESGAFRFLSIALSGGLGLPYLEQGRAEGWADLGCRVQVLAVEPPQAAYLVFQ